MLDYPLHDKDFYLEFVLGMWLHTHELRGKPTAREMRLMLPKWPRKRFQQLRTVLARHGQVAA